MKIQPIATLREAARRQHQLACNAPGATGYMSIPPDFDRDADLLISGALDELSGRRESDLLLRDAIMKLLRVTDPPRVMQDTVTREAVIAARAALAVGPGARSDPNALEALPVPPAIGYFRQGGVYFNSITGEALPPPAIEVPSLAALTAELDAEKRANAALRAELEAAQRESAATDSTPQHHDDVAVTRFAEAMRAKMAASRAKGRSGWETTDCTRAWLSRLLFEHLLKPDIVDVGNFAMMLHQRGELLDTTWLRERLMCVAEATRDAAIRAARRGHYATVEIKKMDLAVIVAEAHAARRRDTLGDELLKIDPTKQAAEIAAAVAKRTFDRFQDQSRRTLENPEMREWLGNFDDDGRIYDAMAKLAVATGVAGEAGEVADLVKKDVWHRKTTGVERLKEEVGDLLWYIAAVATLYGFNLGDAAEANVAKLRGRFPDGFSFKAAADRADEGGAK